MTALLIVAALFLGLTVLFGWALWHLMYDEKRFPGPTPTIHHVNLDELSQTATTSTPPVPKETPATSQLYIPPTYFPGRILEKTGFSISGMGGSWAFPRNLTSTRRRRWPRLDN
jgi:hypothetical protein